MKELIVNADDFGYSSGVNKGIIEAHTNGIVTGTSVMVGAIAANETIMLKDYPDLAVGLHFVPGNSGNTYKELDEQISKFIELTKNQPTHIDIHKVRTDDIELKSSVAAYAEEKGLPFRYSGKTHFIDSFFGPHANGDVSINQLYKSLEETTEGLNELMCHVGYVDDYLKERSSYNNLREEELLSICNPQVQSYLQKLNITLTNWQKTNN